MNDAQGATPVLPCEGQCDPEPAVLHGEPGTLLHAFVNGNLLSKGEVFQHDRVLVFSEQPYQSK